MSKFDDCFAGYEADLKEMGHKYDVDLLRKVAKGLGPSIYLKDASLVSCGDQSETDRVKTNYVVKKLGMANDAKADAAVKAVCDEYKSKRRKRAVFYYLVCEKLGGQKVYG